MFFFSFIKQLLAEGHTVDIATNEITSSVPECYREWGCEVYPISCSRSPFRYGNIEAIRQIRKIVVENYYDLVHCHTPIAAMCTRLACRPLRKNGVKVFYTAHGFHFYKGAPLKNWILYYPVEWVCSWMTDVLIAINTEDYKRAKKYLCAKRIEYVPGVGIDTSKFGRTQVDKEIKRAKLGIPKEATLLLSVGELNENKNHETAIRAVAGLDKNIHYIIVGKGEKQKELEKLVGNLRLNDRVKLLGFRNDVDELYKISDIFLFPSFREGLSASLMEAMASGLPCAVSRIRGNTDLINEKGGTLFAPHSVEECRDAIEKVLGSGRESMGKLNMQIVNKFDIHNVNNQMQGIYIKES